MGLMYEIPSFGRTYFEGDTMDKPVVVGVGVGGVQLLDASDGDRPVLAEYGFEVIASFVCSDEARSAPALAWLVAACSCWLFSNRFRPFGLFSSVIPSEYCYNTLSLVLADYDSVKYLLFSRRENNVALVAFEQE